MGLIFSSYRMWLTLAAANAHVHLQIWGAGPKRKIQAEGCTMKELTKTMGQEPEIGVYCSLTDLFLKPAAKPPIL